MLGLPHSPCMIQARTEFLRPLPRAGLPCGFDHDMEVMGTGYSVRFVGWGLQRIRCTTEPGHPVRLAGLVGVCIVVRNVKKAGKGLANKLLETKGVVVLVVLSEVRIQVP